MDPDISCPKLCSNLICLTKGAWMTTRFTAAFVTLIAGLISISLPAIAETANRDVLKAAQQFIACWDSKGTACMGKMLTEDFVMVPRLSRLLDKKAFITEFEAGRFGAFS